MAGEEAREPTREELVPPASEEVHLPGPTYIPIVVALGITLVISGLVLGWTLVGIGLIVTAVAVYLWIRDTRRDISELPLEHGH